MENKNSKKLKLTFYGGVGTVAGSNFLLENEGMRILIDAGLEDGLSKKEDGTYFSYDPASIDVLLVTHSHLGNIGMIPFLVKAGFKGRIYSTPETKELSELIFLDSIKAFKVDGVSLLSKEDIDKSLSVWGTYPYYTSFDIGSGFGVEFKNSGHFLGSAIVEIIFNNKKIAFTGCMGNSPHPLLKNVDFVNDIDYLVMESVYGDKLHESKEDRREMLEDIIEETVNRKGTLIIPTFSFERTQDILFELHRLSENGEIPEVPIFIDSPFSERIIEIYEKGYENFNSEAKKMMKEKKGIFDFPRLKFIETDEESVEIYGTPNPKIIIGGAGMSSKKRITRHEKKYLPDPNSTILFVEYQSVGSLGRQLQEGASVVKINGEDVPSRVQVETINGYSSHGDYNSLFEFVSETRRSLKQVFVVIGEPKSSISLVQKLRDYLGVYAVFPKKGGSYDLDFSL